MRTCLLFITLFVFTLLSCAREDHNLSYLRTFAKTYGYVKYFHPSDESVNIDWNNFGVYGAQEILKCENDAALLSTMRALFEPIAPSIVFSDIQGEYNFSMMTPSNTHDYFSTYWQHTGVSTGMSRDNGIYSSVRVNRTKGIDRSSRFGNLMTGIDPDRYGGKEIKFSGWLKLKEGSKGSVKLWLRVDNTDGSQCFFDNMGDRPVKSPEWQHYEIIGEVCESASNIVFGSFLLGKGTAYLDDVQLHYKEDGEWIEIPILNGDFEADSIGEKTDDTDWRGRGDGFEFALSDTQHIEGKQCGVITHVGKIEEVDGSALFEASPEAEELVEKKVGDNIYCQFPLRLYSDSISTFPISTTFKALESQVENVNTNPSSLSVRLANVINTYNVFQHFYPYFDEVDVDWAAELDKAFERSFTDQSGQDHLVTLQKFTAPLKDGHISLGSPYRASYIPPIYWEWVEDKLIITEVNGDSLDIEIGDVVTMIDGQSTKDYFEEVRSRYSAGTEGNLAYRAQNASLLGDEGTEIKLQLGDKAISLTRNTQYDYTHSGIAIQESDYKRLENDIYYLNLSTIEMDTITSLMPQLSQSKGIICDLRGYPKGNHDLISHLLNKKDTSTAWMQVAQIIYPDQEDITGFTEDGWEMEPLEPYLGDKNVVFLIDGRAISYAESFMGFIEGYDLATIIGQPTAGTNGNVNAFKLLGDFSIYWTGMKVYKHDGSQHHAIGILPDIYVEKTIEGVKAGRDEFLEKALDVIKKS